MSDVIGSTFHTLPGWPALFLASGAAFANLPFLACKTRRLPNALRLLAWVLGFALWQAIAWIWESRSGLHPAASGEMLSASMLLYAVFAFPSVTWRWLSA